MTVAAVILAATPESALADADGLPRVRRIVEAAWAGGALPVVVVAPDPDGRVATELAGAEVTLAPPAPIEGGPAAQMVRGIEVAMAEVTETSAALLWPARVCWTGPETVTSLIEAHGAEPAGVLGPTYRGELGWPRVYPVRYLDELRAAGADRMPDDALTEVTNGGVPSRSIELGDPGAVIDGSTPRAALPPYEGPPGPLSDHHHEWGEALADQTEGP